MKKKGETLARYRYFVFFVVGFFLFVVPFDQHVYVSCSYSLCLASLSSLSSVVSLSLTYIAPFCDYVFPRYSYLMLLNKAHRIISRVITYSRSYTTKYGDAVIYAVYFTNKYGNTVIYAVYFTVAWLITRTNMEVL